MLQKRRPDDTRRLLRLRHTDEWVGLLVVLALALFFGAIFEAGVLKRWLNPDLQLRIMLPQNNFGGLASGADIEVMGTHAGNVNRIVLNPDGEMYAEATIQRQIDPFIRRDSKAVVRKRFGVAGAAYLDISRGSGAPLDWQYALIDAVSERDPTENIGAMIDEVKQIAAAPRFSACDNNSSTGSVSSAWSALIAVSSNSRRGRPRKARTQAARIRSPSESRSGRTNGKPGSPTARARAARYCSAACVGCSRLKAMSPAWSRRDRVASSGGRFGAELQPASKASTTTHRLTA